MIDPKTPYAISFDTHDTPGKIKAITVQLSVIYMSMTDRARIDLVDHPLYAQLESYVRNNPSRARQDD